MPRTRSLAWAELKLGVVGVVALVLMILVILAVGGQGGFFWQRVGLKARFDDIQGLKVGAAVRVSGKDVGKVTDVQFSGAQVEVAMQIARDVRPLVTSESVAKIAVTRGPTGNFDRGGIRCDGLPRACGNRMLVGRTPGRP